MKHKNRGWGGDHPKLDGGDYNAPRHGIGKHTLGTCTDGLITEDWERATLIRITDQSAAVAAE